MRDSAVIGQSMKPPSSNQHFALVWIGGVYVAGFIALHLDTLSGPRYLELLQMRPERAARALAAVAALFSGDLMRTILFPAAYGALFFAYVWGLYRLRFDAVSQRALFLWAGLFAVLLILLPPHATDDMTRYAMQGRVLAAYHQNPYLHTIKDMGDSWTKYGQWDPGWVNTVPYGPVTVILSAGTAELGGSSFPLTLVLLKLLMAACCFLTGWLVLKISDGVNPSASVAVLFFFLWNPLLLFEGIGHGHNDAIMMALMMMGLYLITKERDTGGLAALVLSVLTKLTTVVLLPLHAWWLLRRRRYLTLLTASLLSLSIVLSFYFLFYRDPRSFDGIRAVGRFAWLSPVWLGGELLHRFAGLTVETARGLVQRVLLAVFVLFSLWRIPKVNSVRSLLSECNGVFLFFLLVVGNQLNSWYFIAAIPLVAVAQSRLGRSIVLLVTALPFSEHFRPLLNNPPFSANLIRTLLFYGILTAILWWHLRRRVSENTSSGFMPREFGN